MTYKHFIAVSSLYSKGIRVAWHYSSRSLDPLVIQNFLNSIKKKFGDIQLGIHRLVTNSPDWDSVSEKDAYFKDVVVIKSADDFISMLSYDNELSAIDVSKFILSVFPMSHLKLQKILYLCYEKFLKKTGIPLFKDEIYAWKYGPVVESVYHQYKIYGSDVIPYEEDDTVIIPVDKITIPPSFMRILVSEHGEVALSIILTVLKKYGKYTAGELVEITHMEGTPWKKVYREGLNKRITDEVILSS